MGRLTGKLAWITGAGTGIGEATAHALAAAGATVVLTGRRPGELARVAETIAAAGGAVSSAPLDVSDHGAVARAAAVITDRHGAVDILVNAAGINTSNRLHRDITREAWDAVVAVNLSGAHYCIQAVLPAMRQRRDGLIVNVASWAGRFVSVPPGVAYTASKAAMVAMNTALNLEEGRNGIRACAVCPGDVATPILDKRPLPPSAEARAVMLQPVDVARAILFVAEMPAHACVNEILISPTGRA